ncbi:MAG: hypothetical protein WA949_18960 [Phormidesmis sp.]
MPFGGAIRFWEQLSGGFAEINGDRADEIACCDGVVSDNIQYT